MIVTLAEGWPLVCVTCSQLITWTSARIEVDRSHEHTRQNPHGYVHRFGCFATATGLRSRGVPSRQLTWFPGYWWHVQECAGCHTHLGWLYFCVEHTFYGLLLAELREAESTPSSPSA